MSRKVSYVPKTVSRIESVLSLFADYCPTGLACFFGEAEFPDTEELAMIASARYAAAEDAGRVDGGKDVPRQQLVLEAAESVLGTIANAGGLEAVRSVFTLYNAEFPNNARLLKEMAYIGRSFRYPSVDEFSYKNHMTPKQFYRKKRKALVEIAWEVYRRKKLSEKVSQKMSQKASEKMSQNAG